MEPETTVVTPDYGTRVPPGVRDAFDIQPGDRLIWQTDESDIQISVKHSRRGFQDVEPFDLQEETHAAQDHDRVRCVSIGASIAQQAQQEPI